MKYLALVFWLYLLEILKILGAALVVILIFAGPAIFAALFETNYFLFGYLIHVITLIFFLGLEIDEDLQRRHIIDSEDGRRREEGEEKRKIKSWFKEGESCNHPGCLNHVTHPCEGCGRIKGSYKGVR